MADSVTITANVEDGATISGSVADGVSITSNVTESTAITASVVTGGKGDTGDTGAAATIAVGTVTTGAAGSSATVANSGTSGAAVFDFAIPQGEQGVQGDPGVVQSVNGISQAAVVLDADDIDDTSTSHKYVTSTDITKLSNLSGTNTGDQDLSTYQLKPSEGAFANGDKTKLDGIETGAEVNTVTPTNTVTLTNKTINPSSNTITGINSTGTIAINKSSVSNGALDVDGDIYSNGVKISTGVWQSWTPTFTNMSGGTLSNNRYTQIGKTIIGQFKYTMSGANVSGVVSFTLPETARSGAMTNSYVKLTKYLTADYFGFINGNIIAVFNSSSTYLFKSNITATVPFTWGANDFIEVMIIYEAA